MQEITLKIEGDRIIIETPYYDANLVKCIKGALPPAQRKWENDKWICWLNDPNQKPEDETNLEYLRRICQIAADTNKWIFSDYSIKSEETIAREKEESAIARVQQKIDAFLVVLPKLPMGSLKLIRWGDLTIKLQLSTYLGENEAGKSLFMELKNASIKAAKQNFTMSFDQKAGLGFVFEIPYHDTIIQALLPRKTGFLTNCSFLIKQKEFEDGAIHLQGEDGKLWIGSPVTQTKMGMIDFDSLPWEIYDSGNCLYSVANAEKFVTSWFDQKGYNVVRFGGAFGVCTAATAELPRIVEDYHLIDWFEEFAAELLNQSDLSCPYKKGFKTHDWTHPADALLDYYARFKEDSGLSAPLMETAKQRIHQLKVEAAQKAIAQAKADAIETARKFLRGQTKTTLLNMAQRHGILLKKSANKDALIAALTQSQDVCEKILGYDKLECPLMEKNQVMRYTKS